MQISNHPKSRSGAQSRQKQPGIIYLIPQPATCSPDSAPHGSADGDGAPGIEVTAEMIEAGISALPYLPEEACNYQEAKLVTAVYRAMRSQAPDHLPCPRK